MASNSKLYIGTSGWSIASRYAMEFPSSGRHLTRYARVFNGVEVTTSFTRSHRRATYERWAGSVPPEFRFSVKLPRTITHAGRLAVETMPLFDTFLSEVAGLGNKLDALLVQLPPSLAFNASDTLKFFAALRQSTPSAVTIACEPRHTTWASQRAEECLASLAIARVAADPSRWGADARPGGSRHLAYFRLHGVPRTYYSNYALPRLEALAGELRASLASGATVRCIFDNTAQGHALDNALMIRGLLDPKKVVFAADSRRAP